MFSFDIDISAFERKAIELGGAIDQIPFALAGAMNEAAMNARTVLVRSTWPDHVSVRNSSFIGAALRVEKANKQNLTVAISSTGSAGARGHLALHSRGGVKTSRGRLAIPGRELKARRTSKGVPKQLRPGALPNSFLKGDTIYQRYGKGGKKLKAMYTLKPSAMMRADVPFESDFTSAMRNGVRAAFPTVMARAMRSRRRS